MSVSQISESSDPLRLQLFQSFIGQSMDQSISPVGSWLNGTLLELDRGAMKVAFVVRRDMTNPMGILHGGIAAAILDDVIGTMVYALGRPFAFTSVNLNCDFLHAARLGESITAHAFVVREGKNIIHVEGEIVSQDNKIIAKCATNMIQTTIKIPELSLPEPEKKS
ncbi:uncharacterized protein (TIGR00369 family) [Dyadobacter jejuensis]|uniref:Uncharacterized protein (TIGR00369 family) n=1 Tax=Dyadobacter jejuensis TaxID=1082580 RepID=A0A316AUE3_9BACT|nr:PaaI family thioesterase [Dyadobacter jejuensis]PWJ60310.1 uncharacterized protein (TIGR00369 family) [Dyadobacter jejuensis]